MAYSKITKLFSGCAIAIALVSIFISAGVSEVLAIQSGFVRIQVRDAHCASGTGTTRSTAGDNEWSAWATDSDDYDPDCVRIWLDNYVTQELDVRLCIQTWDEGGWFGAGGGYSGTECTPWAADGGGWSSWAIDPDAWAIDKVRIKVDTRALSGRYISQMRVGWQNSMALGDNCSDGKGSAEYSPYMSSGGGWSDWAPEGNNEGSFGCSRVYIGSVTVTGQSCSFNGSTVLSGHSVTAYQSSSVAYGSSCVSQARTCTNGSLSGSYAYASCTVQPPPTPTVTVYGTKTGTAETTSTISLTASENITNIRWDSTNATSCSKVAGPSDFSVSGTDNSDSSVTSPNAGGSTTFTVSCTGAGGTVQDSIQVTRASAPTVTLYVTATGQSETGSNITIDPDDTISLRWASTNATSCNATAGSGFSASGTSGTDASVTPPGSGSAETYTVACSGLGGNASDSLTVTAQSIPPVFTVSPDGVVGLGDTVTFTWALNGNEASSCSFSGPGVPATVSGENGTFDLVIQGSSEFRFTCLGGYVEVDVEVAPEVFES